MFAWRGPSSKKSSSVFNRLQKHNLKAQIFLSQLLDSRHWLRHSWTVVVDEVCSHGRRFAADCAELGAALPRGARGESGALQGDYGEAGGRGNPPKICREQQTQNISRQFKTSKTMETCSVSLERGTAFDPLRR